MLQDGTEQMSRYQIIIIFLFPFKLAGGDTESFTSLAMWNSLSVFWKIGEDDLLSVMMKAQWCL